MEEKSKLGKNTRKLMVDIFGTDDSSLSSSSTRSSSLSSASSPSSPLSSTQTSNYLKQKDALKKKVDDLLRCEAEWNRVEALKREPQLCHWKDCPYEDELFEDLWAHIYDLHVFLQPFFNEDGELMYSGTEDQQAQDSRGRRTTRNHRKDHICLWEQCQDAARRLMTQAELLAHINDCHLLKQPKGLVEVERPRSEEFTPEVLKCMREEVQKDLRTKAGLGPGEPVFKEKVQSVTGDLRDLKPGEVLSNGEMVVRVFDERFFWVNNSQF